jgi:hypothetical protein
MIKKNALGLVLPYALLLFILVSCKKDRLTPSNKGSHLTSTTAAASMGLVEELSPRNYSFENVLTFPNAPLNIVRGLYNESSRAGAIALSTEVSRDGISSVRFELSKTDAANYNDEDPRAYLYERAELTRVLDDLGHDRWYGFSNFLPADFATDPNWDLISQLKSKADHPIEAARNPNFCMLIRNDHYYVAVRYSAEPINSWQSAYASLKLFDLGAVDKNAWTDWVIHIKLSYEQDGVLEVWKNNRPVINYTGPNSYNDQRLPVFSIGMYKFDWETAEGRNASPEEQRVIYFDALRVGSGD